MNAEYSISLHHHCSVSQIQQNSMYSFPQQYVYSKKSNKYITKQIVLLVSFKKGQTDQSYLIKS